MGSPRARDSGVAGGPDRVRRERQDDSKGARFGRSAKRQHDLYEFVESGESDAAGISQVEGERVGIGGMEALMLRRALAFCAAAACVLAQAKFQAHEIATGMTGGYQVVIADLNHDGKPDIIPLASGLKELAWYENPGWQKHVIVEGINQPINLAVVKNDKSGVTIALAVDFSPNAARSMGTVMILESTGDVTQPFKRTDIDKLPTSHRLRMLNGL